MNRYVGHVGPIEVGNISYGGSNRSWVWATLTGGCMGYGPSAKTALELWLATWLENFRSLFEG